MLVAMSGFCRSPGYWENPEEFLPFERFASANGNPNEITEDFRYLPFGAGPRKCIGDQFASLQARLTLAMLLRRFDFQLVRADRVQMTTGATIHTTEGLYMRVLARSKTDRGNAAPLSRGGEGEIIFKIIIMNNDLCATLL